MYYALAVLTRWLCPPKRQPPHKITELNETKPSTASETGPEPSPEPNTPKPPPSSPVIAPIDTTTYPDLPTLNPSLVREDEARASGRSYSVGDDGTYSV